MNAYYAESCYITLLGEYLSPIRPSGFRFRCRWPSLRRRRALHDGYRNLVSTCRGGDVSPKSADEAGLYGLMGRRCRYDERRWWVQVGCRLRAQPATCARTCQSVSRQSVPSSSDQIISRNERTNARRGAPCRRLRQLYELRTVRTGWYMHGTRAASWSQCYFS